MALNSLYCADVPLKAVLNVFFFFASFKLHLFNEYEMVFIIA